MALPWYLLYCTSTGLPFETLERIPWASHEALMEYPRNTDKRRV